ncbi:unnamed protein product, partial [Didymodactylos carnosus]
KLDAKKYYYDVESNNDLNLLSEKGLGNFLILIRFFLGNIQENHKRYDLRLMTITFAFIIDLSLSVMALIRILLYDNITLNHLLTIYSLADISTLSIFVILFLITVSRINHKTTYCVLKLLKELKREGTNQILRIQKRTKKESKKEDRQMGRCDIELLQVNNEYLSDTIEYFESAKNKYSITLFGQIIDKALVTKVVISIVGTAGSAIFGLIAKEISSNLHK